MFTHFFIKRPIFASVVALVILALGAVTYTMLAVEQFPNVVPPTVSVTANWPGASAEDIVNSVGIPIESEVNGVDHMIYMESNSTNSGNYKLMVTFAIGTDPDLATTLVQNRVNRATPRLPADVNKIGVITQKESANIVLIINLFDRIENAANEKRIAQIRAASKTVAAEHGHESQGDPPMASEPQNDWEFDAAGKIVNAKTGEVYTPLTSLYLSNYAKNYVRDVLARVPGVGGVTLYDARDFSMRIWLDRDLLTARNLSAQEVVAIIAEQNRMVSAGRVGAPPAPIGQETDIVLTLQGRLDEVSQFENLVIRTDNEGRTLHLRDIARVELGSVSYTTSSHRNGMTTTTIGITQLPGANAIEVAEGVAAALASLEQDFASRGIAAVPSYDATQFVRVSIDEVKKTLIEAVFIVIFVVYVFLQNWRAALIPTLTVPVSLVGAFFMMMLFGFTVNTLTLFALVLVIGIVVDDSILVVENTQRILDEHPELSPYRATQQSMLEMFSPVVGTTTVLMAVFIPTALIAGLVGQFYKQFALTIASAVGISGVCALTVAPALCCVLLRSQTGEKERKLTFGSFVAKCLTWVADTALTTIFILLIAHMFGWHGWWVEVAAVAAGVILFCPFLNARQEPFFFGIFNAAFGAATNGYVGLMRPASHAAFIALVWLGLIVVGLVAAFKIMPAGFLPSEDQGVLFVDVRLPEGASIQRTDAVMTKLNDLINANRDGIKTAVLINGYSMMTSMSAANAGMGFIVLDHWDKRRSPELSVMAIQERLTAAANAIPDARIFYFSPPPILGIGTSGGLEMRLQDRSGRGAIQLSDAGQTLLSDVRKSGTVIFGQSTFDPTAPRYFLHVDRDKVKRLQLSLDDVFGTLGTMVGSTYVNDFNKFNQSYRVTLQAKDAQRSNIEAILSMTVKNSFGNMIPFRTFSAVEMRMGPELITRFNQFPVNSMTAIVMPGRSSGEAIAAVQNTVATALPEGYSLAWTGMTYQEVSVGNQTMLVFGMSILFALLILSALYESWSSPVVIMLAVPMGVMGALAALALFGMPINMYTQVGLIIMVGLSAKNAILITEVARELRIDHKMGLAEAAITAGRQRMRPIMMTSYAFILGVLPLAVATGAGALGRNAIGIAVCGGMLNETMIGIFVTPLVFIILQSYSEWFAKFLKAIIGDTGNDGSDWVPTKSEPHA
ncbi:MAG: efflux RND transporter permease subunit [Thermoguttaceae bacterium]